MSIDTEKLIKEVAVRHQVLLSKDDPIFVAVTLNELVLSDYLSLIKASHTELIQQLEDSRQQENHHLATTIENLRLALGDAVSELPSKVKNSTHSLVVELRNELSTNLEAIQKVETKLRKWQIAITISFCLLASTASYIVLFVS